MPSDIQLSVDLEPGDVTRAASNLESQIENIFKRTAGKNVSNAFVQLQISMDKAYTRAINLQEKMRQMEGTKIPTEQYAQLESELGKLDAQYTKLEQKRRDMENAGKMNTAPYYQLEQQLNGVYNAATKLRQQMDLMEQAGTSHIAAEESAEYANLTNQLNQTNNQMRIYVARAYEAGEVQPRISGWNALTGAINGVASAARSAGSAIKALLGKLASLAKQGITSGIQKLKDSIFNLGRSSSSTNNSLSKGLKSLMRYGLGVRSVFALVNKLRRALLEGFKNLAGYSSSFNHTISNFISSLNYLKNSFAAAFAPLVETVLPVLTRFIDMLAEGVNKLGEFFAALTGKQTFVRAKKVYTSYVKSVDKSTDKTQTKLEKLQRTILGFDDVNILKGPEQETPISTAMSDYDPSTDPKNMFDTVKIGSAISDWAKKFKEMWAKADFTELGRIVGEKIKAGLELIPWDAIKSVLRRVGKSIATFLNGVLETPGLFSTIGYTIAQALNSAFEFVNAFVQNFHWDSLGFAIRDLVVGALDNLDWDLIQETCVGMAGGIGTTIESALDNPEIWHSIFTTFANGVNTFTYSAKQFFDSIDWRSTGSNVGKGLNDGVNTIDWPALGNTIGTALKDVLNGLSSFVQEVDWQNLGHNVKEMLVNIDWAGVFDAVFEAIGSILGGLVGFIVGLLKDIPGAIKKFFADHIQEARDAGGNIVTGILSGIWDIIKGIGKWIYEHIFKPFIDGFKKAFGIKSPSTVMKEQGGYIIKGLLNGITGGLKAIGSWVKKHVFEPISGSFKKAFNIVGGVANKVKSVGSSIIHGIKGGLSNKFKDVTDWVLDKMPELKDKFENSNTDWTSVGTNICNGISNGISNGWSWLTEKASGLASSIFESAKGALGIASPSKLFRDKIGKMIPAGLAIGIDAETGTALKSVTGMTDQLVSAASNIQLPPIALGKIIPYEIGKSTQQDTNNTLNDVLEMLQYNQDAMVTRDDLLSILTDVARRYFNIELRLNNVALARAVNKGNDELSRRFSTT